RPSSPAGPFFVYFLSALRITTYCLPIKYFVIEWLGGIMWPVSFDKLVPQETSAKGEPAQLGSRLDQLSIYCRVCRLRPVLSQGGIACVLPSCNPAFFCSAN
ncbi:MAG TPA: hypothetical protein VK364_07645, partial [Hymenobacter sp.]|nr:hypothetical protein [Hymenobacter sp.]